MMKLACAVTLAMVLGAVARAGPFHEDTPHTFCGRHLANARLLLCFGATENMRKRSSPKSSPLLALLRSEEVATTASELAEQQFYRTALGLTVPAKRIGIVDECCLKPCYISELLNYC